MTLYILGCIIFCRKKSLTRDAISIFSSLKLNYMYKKSKGSLHLYMYLLWKKQNWINCDYCDYYEWKFFCALFWHENWLLATQQSPDLLHKSDFAEYYFLAQNKKHKL